MARDHFTEKTLWNSGTFDLGDGARTFAHGPVASALVTMIMTFIIWPYTGKQIKGHMLEEERVSLAAGEHGK